MGYSLDILFALIFLVYPFVLLFAAKGLEKKGLPKDFTRKFVHIGTGLVILFVPLFTHLWIALIPPIIFTIANLIDYKFGWLSQIQGEDAGNVGTILYPISFIILILVFFDKIFWGLAVLGILAMAFGDAGASLIGRNMKSESYEVNGEKRSVAGSMTMFVITFFVAYLVFLFYGAEMGITVRFLTLVSISLILAGVATITEGLSIRGSDNLLVPVLTAFSGWVLLAVILPNILGNQAIVNQPLF